MVPSTTSLTLILAILACAGSLSLACMPSEFRVSPAGKAANGTSATAFSQDQVLEAFEGLNAWAGKYVDPNRATYSCVDSRGSHDGAPTSLQTPGGDLAELALAIVVYHRMVKMNPTAATVEDIFRTFMKEQASPSRPFYFHSSDAAIQYAFDAFAKYTGQPRPVALPDHEPKGNSSETEAWYKSLTMSKAQGCGHIKLLMDNAAAYGIETEAEAAVMPNLIKAFFKYWWHTKEGSLERKRVTFPLLQGSLGGRAMAIVTNKGPSCLKQEPDMNPYHGGTSLFVYQPSAADQMRKNIMTPFFHKYAKSKGANLSQDAFYKGITALQGVQTGETLKLLSPVNTIDIWSVDVTTI